MSLKNYSVPRNMSPNKSSKEYDDGTAITTSINMSALLSSGTNIKPSNDDHKGTIFSLNDLRS